MGCFKVRRVKEIMAEMQGCVSRTVKEIKEDLKIMGIEKEDFAIPEKLFNILYIDEYEFDEEFGIRADDIEEKEDRSFGFDVNRIAKVWERSDFVLLYASSDGRAEAGYFLFLL